MTGTKDDLLHMLKVADNFSCKWIMFFNENKSQVVMTIGQTYPASEKWNIGDKQLSATKTYKYLGVIINKWLRDSNHINDHLAEIRQQARI